MRAPRDLVPQQLAELPLVRRVVGALAAGRARRRLARFDRQSVARSQMRTLLGLIHQAQATRFGRDHDFRRIRSEADFRRLVPLRAPAELWRDYWQPAFPHLGGTTWPGPIANLAVPELAFTGPFPCVPVSPALSASFREAAFTALAFAVHARPHARPFDGRVLLLGEGTEVNSVADPIRAGSWEVLAAREAPLLLRPYLFSPTHLNGSAGTTSHERLLALAEASAGLPVTCLAGTSGHIQQFFKYLKQATGADSVARIWPRLAVILCAGRPERATMAREIGATPGMPPALILEACFRPEGPIAVEDPRYGCLRLLTDHGVYFEFVPVDQLCKLHPPRLSVAEVEVDVPYALAVTSPAGLWACLLGIEICFERCSPPLVRLVQTRRAWPVPAAATPQQPTRPALPPPHRFSLVRTNGLPPVPVVSL